ncbi:MAG: choice-of-anchor D domain-containing protein, partial [Actinomycetota bacterium]|nr:choice-of-anchor D domain-containing protein [Actinomycetota bacterium]
TGAGARGGGAAGAGAAASSPELSVDPMTLRFRPTLLTAVTETVTVRNEGDVPFTLDAPELSGDDPEAFDVDDGSCAGRSLASGRSCELSVTFDPSGVGRANAILVVSVKEDGQAKEVSLDAVGAG